VLAAGQLPPTLNESHRKYLQDLVGVPTRPRDPGLEVYEQGCLPCHQPEGKGLPGVYPPLAGSEWVRGDADRLIRIVLHGLTGPVTVAGANYGGPDSVPMPSMAGLTDEQISDVLTYVRRDFGNGAPTVPSSAVKRIRESNATRNDPWTAEELGMGPK
jgi:mono/diheme cytochrome c family protein